MEISESTIHDTALIGIETLSSVLTTYSTHVDENDGAGIASYASTLHFVGSTANHNGNIGMGLSHNSAGILESSDVSWNTHEGISAGGSSVSLINSTSTHNGGAGVWGESISVSLSGNTVISDNGTGILATSSSLAGGGVIRNNVGCGLMMFVGSFAIGAGLSIEQPGGCAISCSNTLAICEPGHVTGQIGGCGDRCLN